MDNQELQQALLAAFAEEAPELITRIDNALAALEVSDTESSQLHLDAMGRPLHSLKGSASVIDRSDLTAVCHAMEDAMIDLPTEPAARKAAIDCLYLGLDFIRGCITSPTTTADNTHILQALAARSCAGLPATEVNEVASVVSAAPCNPAATSSSKPTSEFVNNKATDNELTIDTIRVATEKIENIQSAIGEVVAIRLQQEYSLSNLKEFQQQLNRLMTDWRVFSHDVKELRKHVEGSKGTKFDTQVNNINQLLKVLTRQSYQVSHQMGNQTAQLTLLSDELDNNLRAVRMMPIRPYLEAYRSSAKDAARQMGKSVTLECRDAGIEVDRLIMEKVKEPLLHMVRNAVSHGIEYPEQRLRVGKPDSGLITLSTELNGDLIYIHIQDDGCGINRQAIYQKALERGLIKHQDELTDQRIIELICMPGFSTADSTSQLAGRGVGMDVVASMITELGGNLSLKTSDQQGTTFTLRIPSSLATTQGLMLQVGDSRYGIMLDLVERIVRRPLEQLDIVEGKKVLYLDDTPIAVASLAGVLEQSYCEPTQQKQYYPIVILRTASHRLSLIVDDIPGEIPMIVKPLGPQYEHIKLYAGGAILSDGQVLPVLEARHIVNLVMENNGYRMLETQAGENLHVDQASEQETSKTILVVDDSITTRTLERNILEAAGYHVLVATDGVEAMDLLTLEDNIAMVVTDMEMPRMGGIELCKRIRTSRYSDVPIVMVTSVGAESEKQKGLEAGADAYIIKGNFQQDHFLATVRRFTNA